jgi:hypothetical protein
MSAVTPTIRRGSVLADTERESDHDGQEQALGAAEGAEGQSKILQQWSRSV